MKARSKSAETAKQFSKSGLKSLIGQNGVSLPDSDWPGSLSTN